MTSIAREIGRPVPLGAVKPFVLRAWRGRFGAEPAVPATSLVPAPASRAPAA